MTSRSVALCAHAQFHSTNAALSNNSGNSGLRQTSVHGRAFCVRSRRLGPRLWALRQLIKALAVIEQALWRIAAKGSDQASTGACSQHLTHKQLRKYYYCYDLLAVLCWNTWQKATPAWDSYFWRLLAFWICNLCININAFFLRLVIFLVVGVRVL